MLLHFTARSLIVKSVAWSISRLLINNDKLPKNWFLCYVHSGQKVETCSFLDDIIQ